MLCLHLEIRLDFNCGNKLHFNGEKPPILSFIDLDCILTAKSGSSCNSKIRSESSHLHLRVASSCGLSASNSATHGSDSPRLRRLAASLKQRASSRSHKTWFRIRVLLSGPGKGVRIQKSNFRIPYLSRKSSLATPGWRLVNKSG